MSVENPTSLTVILSPGVQKFEVSSEDSLLVSGGYSTEDVSPTFATISEESSGSMVLDKEAIYKVTHLWLLNLSHRFLNFNLNIFKFSLFKFCWMKNIS